MRLNNARIQELLGIHNMTQLKLAMLIGIERSSLSNALSGRRGAGRKILAGLLHTFPDESFDSLTVPKRQVAK